MFSKRSRFSFAARLVILIFRQEVRINNFRGVSTVIPKTLIMARNYSSGVKLCGVGVLLNKEEVTGEHAMFKIGLKMLPLC